MGADGAGRISVKAARQGGFWGMTPFQVFTSTFILMLIFAALVTFLLLNAAEGTPLLKG